MNVQRATALVFLASTLALTGCKPDAAVHRGEVIDKGTGPATSPANAANTNAPLVDPAQAGSISGTIHFKGTPPPPMKIDMSMDPACTFAGENPTEQYVVSGGKLANVYVYVKSGLTPSMVSASSTPVVLDQKGCRYIPHVIALQQGGSVTIRNSDPTMHNVHILAPEGTGVMDISQGPMGAPQTQQFPAVAVMLPIRCNNHPWMNAFINVAPSPYFAVTGKDGNFTIQGLPAGTYTLAAVHEKLGEQDIEVKVAAKTSAKADFTFAAK